MQGDERHGLALDVSADLQASTVQLCITEACNLSCVYCFEGHKTKRRMSAATARDIAVRFLEDGSSASTVEFDFAGGEPLLAFEVMQEIVQFVHSRPWKRSHVFNFTTNGTLLDDEIKVWLGANACVRLSISFDGTRDAHNANRTGSYDKAVAHVPWLLERCRMLRHTTSTKMTISPHTVSQIADGVIHLHGLGFHEVNANVPYENLWRSAGREELLLTFASQLDRLVDFYAARPDLTPPQLVKLPIHRIFSDEALSEQRWCGGGGAMICYDPDGRAYPCHRFLPLSAGPGRRYTGDGRLPRGKSSGAKASECSRCRFVNACPSCLGFNWQTNGNPDDRTRFHCPFILIQLKASAKLEVLHVSRQLQPPGSSIVAPGEVGRLQNRLCQAMRVLEILS